MTEALRYVTVVNNDDTAIREMMVEHRERLGVMLTRWDVDYANEGFFYDDLCRVTISKGVFKTKVETTWARKLPIGEPDA